MWGRGAAARAPSQQLQENLLPLGKDRLGALLSRGMEGAWWRQTQG